MQVYVLRCSVQSSAGILNARWRWDKSKEVTEFGITRLSSLAQILATSRTQGGRSRTLHSLLARRRDSQGLDAGPLFEVKDLILDLLAYAFRYTLGFIAKAHADLRWPVFGNPDDYKDWNPEQVIQVSLPLPVATAPEHVALITRAAIEAGLPNPYICGEPAAALVYHLSRSAPESAEGKIIMIIDVGAGSADFEAWWVVSIHPFWVKQLVAPQTRWCRGRTVNVRFRELFLDELSDCRAVVLESLRKVDRTMTWETFGDALETCFEAAKRDFRGNGNRGEDESYMLHIPGVPEIAEKGMPKSGIVIVTADQIREAH
ncbi:hypothetical protein A1O1_07300 [Capronia coronata CBS 617.96]|uniref:Uncharacterized protein n=1 Tax=Capronia coronata CBS 617.96 TaxID=1182541 RepID=W9Y354_9EURO|nr:uncharacterized protein A1O1_07300 [Capronia coronata CBS 617.96]EXJ83676.1 hypothetical protein A1O1_07300 [Capronia coronata CBS 617.96]